MEEEEGRQVGALEKDLNSLSIKEEPVVKSEEEQESHDDRVEELKAKFRAITLKAKNKAKVGDLEDSLRLYRKAYKLHKSEKVAKRIQHLETILQESDGSATDDGYVTVVAGFKLSAEIYNKLYPYQKEGVAWFWKLFQQKKGGILGDDMGLGKTIQVISFLSGMFEQEHIRTALIVMPVSLLANWEKEFKKWAPEIRVRCFHGSSQKQRLADLAKIQSRNGVCLTTYGLANTCHNQFSQDKYGNEFTWDYVILDEGHKIKNTANKTTQAIRGIPAINHFILTGTPIQNNLREMWALFDYVCEGKLLGSSRTFKQEYENPIVRARERDATAYEKRIGQEMSNHLRELIAPHFLRRTKAILEDKTKTSNDEVDGNTTRNETVDQEEESQHKVPKAGKLTRKNDLIIWLYLSETQLQIYKDFIQLDRVKEILMTTRSPLAELNILKKICDHPRLLSTMACRQLGLNEEQDDVEYEDSQDHEWCAPPVELLIQESGKMVFLVQLLERLKAEDHRTLVFSQSRKMLDIIQKVLVDKGIKIIRIDGTITSIVERESRINKFQTDPSYTVFLLTTQVGGVGLTLTAADRVVIFDPSWNPATDAQAVDRVYRIGQKKTVVIYRLITCASLEEKIYRKQVFKQAITKQTTGSSKNPFRYFTRHELREMFVLDDPKSSKTQIQLEKMHSANRVSDPVLDEHVAFLYSTDIFGISDHDLLFTKEAVATQEELHAAQEMSDVIQAKIRRAVDIMKAESSQALYGQRPSNNLDTPPVNRTPGVTKKNQTRIPDHLEIFVPSREDSKRFRPTKKKTSPPADVVDLTMLEHNNVDEEKLEKQFSAISINENHDSRNDSGPTVKEIVLDDSNNNINFSAIGSNSEHQDYEEDVISGDAVQNGIHCKSSISESQRSSEKSDENSGSSESDEVSPTHLADDVKVKTKEREASGQCNARKFDAITANSSLSEVKSKDFIQDVRKSCGAMSPSQVTADGGDDDDFGVVRSNRVKKENVTKAFSDKSDVDKDDGTIERREMVEEDIQEGPSYPSEVNDDMEGQEGENVDVVFAVTPQDLHNPERNPESKARYRAADLDSNDEWNFPNTPRKTNGGIRGSESDIGKQPKEIEVDLVPPVTLESSYKRNSLNAGQDPESEAIHKVADFHSGDDLDSEEEVRNFRKNIGKNRPRILDSDSDSDEDDDKDLLTDGKNSENDALDDKTGEVQFQKNSSDSETPEKCFESDSNIIEDGEKSRHSKIHENSSSSKSGQMPKPTTQDNTADRNTSAEVLIAPDVDEENFCSVPKHVLVEQHENEESGVSKSEGETMEFGKGESGIIVDSEDETIEESDKSNDSKSERDVTEDNEDEGVEIEGNKGKAKTITINDEIVNDSEDEMIKNNNGKAGTPEDSEEETRMLEDAENVIMVSESEDEATDESESEDEIKSDDKVVKIGDSESENEGAGSEGDSTGSSDEIKSDDKVVKIGDSESENEGTGGEGDSTGSSDDNSDQKEKKSEDDISKTDELGTDEDSESSREEDDDEMEAEKENVSSNTPNKIKDQVPKGKTVLHPTANRKSRDEVPKNAGKTSCCPSRIHVSELFDIHRCPCLMSSENKKAYIMHVNTGRQHEKTGEHKLSLQHYIAAYRLCDSDEILHRKIQKGYGIMKSKQRR